MTTLDKTFADNIVAHNGYYNGDSSPSADNPRCTRIVEYRNAWGNLAYGATFEGQDPDKYMEPTMYVQEPRIYWELKKEQE